LVNRQPNAWVDRGVGYAANMIELSTRILSSLHRSAWFRLGIFLFPGFAIAACSLTNSVDPPTTTTGTGGSAPASVSAGGQTATGTGGSEADPSCTDNAKNGAETDVDCGGDTCDPCENDKGCALAGDCVSGFCAAGTTCAACTETANCAEVVVTYCQDGVCTPTLDLGTECVADDNCKSGFCPSGDGLCCDTECANICEGCRAADTGGTDGSCSAITKDSDPADECPSTTESCEGDTCDGAGACAVKAEGTVCDTAYLCDGTGATCASN